MNEKMTHEELQHRRIIACLKFCKNKSTEWLEQNGTIDEVVAGGDAPARGRNDCPQCGASMLLLATQNKKICVDCCAIYPWELTDGQKPLVSAQR